MSWKWGFNDLSLIDVCFSLGKSTSVQCGSLQEPPATKKLDQSCLRLCRTCQQKAHENYRLIFSPHLARIRLYPRPLCSIWFTIWKCSKVNPKATECYGVPLLTEMHTNQTSTPSNALSRAHPSFTPMEVARREADRQGAGWMKSKTSFFKWMPNSLRTAQTKPNLERLNCN